MIIKKASSVGWDIDLQRIRKVYIQLILRNIYCWQFIGFGVVVRNSQTRVSFSSGLMPTVYV